MFGNMSAPGPRSRSRSLLALRTRSAISSERAAAPVSFEEDSARKAKDLGYPHELWTTRLLASHAREHGPAQGHAYLAHLAQGTAPERAEELINIRHQLTTLSAADPMNGVRQELRRRADSCAAARPNGWRTATY